MRTVALPTTNRLSAILLCFAAAVAPLPFGSTDPSAVAFWCIVLGAAAVLASPRDIDRRHFIVLGVMALVVALTAIVIYQQLAARPWGASPNPIWAQAAHLLGEPLQSSVSIARNQPFFAAGSPLAVALSGIAGFVVGSDGRHARLLLRIIAWSGALYAAYAIVAFAIDPTHVLWRAKQAHTASLTGTFLNRNTAAVYFGACAIIWLLLLLEAARSRRSSGAVRRSQPSTRVLGLTWSRELAIPAAALATCLFAMFLTGSRAGVVLSLAAILVAGLLFMRRDFIGRRDLAGRRRPLVVAAIAAAALLVLLQIWGARVASRFDLEALADGGRFGTYESTVRMISDHPWLGTGLGTFLWSYPPYRTDAVSVWGVWDRAHNTVLELAADVGVPLTLAIAAGWVAALLLLVHGVRVRRRGLIFPVAALSVASLAMCHSLIDFSLQIPGFIIPVFALAGAGLAQSFARPAATRAPAEPDPYVPLLLPANDAAKRPN